MARPAHARSGRMGYQAGMAAELRIAQDYERRGFPVTGQRWRGTLGEIDLIAQDGEGLIFVEVKQSRSFARAAERLSAAQMRRIYASAEEYLGTQPKGQLTPVRFDVALVDGIGAVQVIENAFGQL
ncbi:YraN family protein [Puniceibacterium sp. IMCC21224]|uniref:YraN family protein n=1 Tax=Puniceibacterium sp. IMCC21224 TaxID=1618204 RepID=UPI00064D9EEA|nr:YraN family protein [Puniceibacterium sp. IMCC21224]